MKPCHLQWLFAGTAILCGAVYWHFADWWFYVNLPDDPLPKFVMPWWGQAIVSGTVGGICAVIGWAAYGVYHHSASALPFSRRSDS